MESILRFQYGKAVYTHRIVRMKRFSHGCSLHTLKAHSILDTKNPGSISTSAFHTMSFTFLGFPQSFAAESNACR